MEGTQNQPVITHVIGWFGSTQPQQLHHPVFELVWTHASIYNLLIQLFLKDRVWRGLLGGGTR